MTDEPLTIKEIQDWQQYWYSKYCNHVDRPHRDVFYALYEDYCRLEELYKQFNQYD